MGSFSNEAKTVRLMPLILLIDIANVKHSQQVFIVYLFSNS